MNDLAEKALRGLDVARRQVRDRPLLSLSIAGFAVSCLVVAAGGRVGAARSTRPLVDWLGLQDTHGLETADPGPGTLMLVALVLLLGLWLDAVEDVRRPSPTVARTRALPAASGAPFAVRPPMLDPTSDHYA